MSGSTTKSMSELEIIMIGFQQALTNLKEYVAGVEQKNMEMELKAAEGNNSLTIEKSDEVIMWEKKLRDKKMLVEALQSQVDTRENHMNQVMLSNDIQLNLAKGQLKSKEEELVTLKAIIGNLPAGNV